MIQSLLRSMELLEVLKEKNRNFSIAELAEAMDLPPSTVHRILQTFCERKYVIRDDRSHTYRLGPALIPLGKAAARGIRLQDAAHSILTQLAKQTKEDAYLVIPVGNKGLVIKKRFRTKAGELEVLHGVNADIKKGEVFGIIGLSGAGKSTLVRCINLLERPTAGKVWLDGVELTGLDEKALREQRRHMGMIFQQFHLLMQRTALDNVCFPMEISGVPKAKAKERAKELLELVGLADRMESYPAQLSGGQKQRVAIARALATEPKVLLCDEATSALDPNTTAGVLSLLKDINTRLGITIVVITHEMSVIQEICDRVAIIDGGLIAEEGSVEEIFRAPKTKIGQELVMHEGSNREAYTGKLPYSYRLVFKGGSENEPVLGQMMIELKNVVNILAANTRTIDNQAFGQMLVQFPEEKALRESMIQYLTERGVEVEEVEYV